MHDRDTYDDAAFCIAYFLPEWVPASAYVKIAHSLGLEDVKQADWSEFVVSHTSLCIQITM